MRSNKLSTILSAALLSLASGVYAQNGYIYKSISSGVNGFSGDGGHASMAQTAYIYGLGCDDAGNIYIGDEQNYRIRKVDPTTGIINTIAGTGTQGYTGDGGPALNADLNGSFNNLCVSPGGDIYFYDNTNYVIRKIDGSTGIITTFAGDGNNYDAGNNDLATNASIGNVFAMTVVNDYLYIAGACRVRRVNLVTDTITAFAGTGMPGYSGDGGPATSAALGYMYGITGDAAGNIYIPDNSNHVIRKIDAGGTITTICGTGQSNVALDNVPAVTATLSSPWDIAIDKNGDLVISDFGNGRIRRINMTTGIINNIAGYGTYQGSTDQAIPALSARVDPRYICVDPFNNVYITESANYVRKLTAQAPAITASSDSFSVIATHECNNVQFVSVITTYDVTPYSIKTYYGDGTYDTHTFVQRQQVEGSSVFEYNYPISGSYPVKHVLFNGTNAVDSIQYGLQYELCRSITANLYYDANSDCSYDANNEDFLSQMASIRVDSNNVTIDTISALGRFTYNSFGSTGDVYTFSVLNLPLGLQVACNSGTFNDTIQSGTYTNTRYIATSCGTGSSFDLSVNAEMATAGNAGEAHITVHNTYCNPQNTTLTMTFSPKYEFASAFPAPTTQSGQVITWDINAGDFENFMAYLHVSLLPANNQPLTPGDTVHSSFSVTPTTGDINTANNTINRVDTVTGPYDPNAVYVSPEGCIAPGTTLQYTVTFENMGNDTAHDIYVMDTLNANVDMSSLQIITSSHTMSFSKLADGGYNILRFDFAGINLPDSSHHDQCHGMVMYTVKSKTTMGLSDIVSNKAGIYFDYMPAVLTNEAITEVCQPQFAGTVNKGSGLRIYPNPASDELNVSGDQSLTGCHVLNQAGQVVLEQEAQNGTARINIKNLPAGVYFIRVMNGKGSEMHKFVKM